MQVNIMHRRVSFFVACQINKNDKIYSLCEMICDVIDTLKNVMGSPPSATDQDTFTEVSDNFSIIGCDGGISMAERKLNITLTFSLRF